MSTQPPPSDIGMRWWLVLIALSGCSFIGVRGPSPDSNKRCTESYNEPIVDTVAATAALALTVLLIRSGVAEADETEEQLNDPAASVAAALTVTTAVLTVGYGASAAYGFHHVHRCRSLRS